MLMQTTRNFPNNSLNFYLILENLISTSLMQICLEAIRFFNTRNLKEVSIKTCVPMLHQSIDFPRCSFSDSFNRPNMKIAWEQVKTS